MINDTLANALSAILNFEKNGKKEIILNPVSKTIRKVLKIMNDNGFIGNYEDVTEAKGGFIKVNLLGSINNCCVVKPRFSAQLDEFEKFEKRFLPAKGIGILIISTPEGMMTFDEAKKKGFGGRLIAYCY
jgi:small subunit ribosomal protein S8